MVESEVTMFSNNLTVIHLSKNPIYYKRTKYVDVKYHFVGELVEKGAGKIQKVTTEENLADIGMKIMTTSKFKHFLDLLHVSTS